MKAVYSYFFPEVRPLVHAADSLSDDFFAVSTSVKKAEEMLGALSFKKPLKLPFTPDGNLDLDMIHEPVIERVIDAYAHTIPALKDFPNRYPMAGSSQGIFHLLALVKAQGIGFIYVLNGEYEGYRAYGETMGIETREIDPEKTDVKKLEPGFWFISNPSARNGNIIENEFINELCELGHKVILDLAYVGITRPYVFDVSHKNIIAIVMSMSKPYGVFRFRIGGFAFSRAPVPSLYANKWFKDVPRLLSALKIVEELPPGALYDKYRPIQESIIQRIREEFDIPIQISDVLLLGYLKKEDAEKLSREKQELIQNFLRSTWYRFCLTPYFEERE